MTNIENVIDSTKNRIYKSYEDNENPRYGRRLGASQLGNECDRALWLGFRWADKSGGFSGRMLKLFKRGQDEEERISNDLKSIGVSVQDVDEKTGKQFNIELLGGHFGGMCDGVGVGFIEAPKSPHVIEYKTHNDKSFKALEKKGVKISKPGHYDQIQVYMHGLSIERAFYIAVNKNDDSLYTEQIKYDEIHTLSILNRAKRIIFTSTPPPKISDRPDFFMCKMCSAYNLCHEKKLPERNCRTCTHSTPLGYGGWKCEIEGSISLDKQKNGCKEHRYIPPMIGSSPVDVENGVVVYEDGFRDDGKN